MKHLLLLFNRARLVVVALGLVGLMVAAVSMWRSSAFQTDKQAEGKRHFHARIRDGVGREIQFASVGDSPGIVRASVNSVDNFIFKRSGVKLSGVAKTRLAEMEERALSGKTRTLSISDLNQVLTETAVERIGRLTNDEIFHVDDTLRGFNAPDLPRSFDRRMVNLPGRLTLISSDKVSDQLKAMRAQMNTPLGAVLKAATHREIEKNVNRLVNDLGEALPETFAGTWDATNKTEGDAGITPLKAVIIAYSVASSDLLCDSEANLSTFMKAKQTGLSRRLGEKFPSPDGHLAFGVNGYLASTPLDLVFDDQTINRMLDLIEERSAA